jgi:catechol 2,3-dioxygenase-like lactoylglutathione lyase family enzyme
MTLDCSIHHINISAHDVRQAVSFYRDIIGMKERPWDLPEGSTRGDFSVDPEFIALLGTGSNSRGLHIVKPVPDFHIKNGLMFNPTIGGHFALTVPDLDAVKRRLDAAGTLYSEGGQYAMAGVRNLYVYDPSMNLVEINQMI